MLSCAASAVGKQPIPHAPQALGRQGENTQGTPLGGKLKARKDTWVIRALLASWDPQQPQGRGCPSLPSLRKP